MVCSERWARCSPSSGERMRWLPNDRWFFTLFFGNSRFIVNSFGPTWTKKIKKVVFTSRSRGESFYGLFGAQFRSHLTSAIDFLMVQFRPRRTHSKKWNQSRWVLWAPIIVKASLSNLHFEKLSFTIANVPQASRKKKKAIWAAVQAFNVLYLRTFSFFSAFLICEILLNADDVHLCTFTLHLRKCSIQALRIRFALCMQKFRPLRSKEMSFAKTQDKGWREESLVQVDRDANSSPGCLKLSFGNELETKTSWKDFAQIFWNLPLFVEVSFFF